MGDYGVTAPLTKRAVHGVRDAYEELTGRGVRFTHQPLGRHIDPQGVRGYYCDFRHKATRAADQPSGWPSSTIAGGPADWVIPVAQAALGYWELGLEGEDTRTPFLAIADWLLDRAEPAPGGLAWYTPYPRPKYRLEPGWASAMGQGEAISVLLRAHQASGEGRYLEVAEAALGPMETTVEEGGVMRRTDGRTVLEEYPTEELCAVLNGWTFALFGLHEMVNATGSERARRLFDASRESLLEMLPEYDVGWWSLYSLQDHGGPDLAKPFYQRLHPVLLRGLHLAAPDERLVATAERWEGQLSGPALARIVANKVRFRARRAMDERRR